MKVAIFTPCFPRFPLDGSSNHKNAPLSIIFQTFLNIFSFFSVVFPTNLVPAKKESHVRIFSMHISTKNPAEMTGEERISEVALILSHALQRLQTSEGNQGIQSGFEKSLTGLPIASERSCIGGSRPKRSHFKKPI